MVYFLGDFHLGAKYLDTHAAERRIISFLDTIAADATHIFLTGDILDYWYEYHNVVPKGYARFFGKLAELTDKGVKITWMIGNHDIWIFDYLPSELGIEVVDGVLETTLLGKNFFISHGDGLGKRSAAFRLIRWMFRNSVCQKLFATIPPRWTIPFAHTWSSHSRDGHKPAEKQFHGNDEPLVKFATEHNSNHPHTDFYIFGHRHVEGTALLPSGAMVVQLGEWISQFSFARWDGKQMQLLNYSPQQ